MKTLIFTMFLFRNSLANVSLLIFIDEIMAQTLTDGILKIVPLKGHCFDICIEIFEINILNFRWKKWSQPSEAGNALDPQMARAERSEF